MREYIQVVNGIEHTVQYPETQAKELGLSPAPKRAPKPEPEPATEPTTATEPTPEPATEPEPVAEPAAEPVPVPQPEPDAKARTVENKARTSTDNKRKADGGTPAE